MTDQMNQAGSAPQPGWYQDPSGPGYRWWDGTSWTDQTHPGTQQAAASPAPAATQTAPAVPAATTPAAAQPSATPAKKSKKDVSGASNWLNDNPLPVVLVLLVLLAIVVVLFVL